MERRLSETTQTRIESPSLIRNGIGERVAFVLSGGGTRGALEAGVLIALLEQGIRPQLLVGTSIGAINATGIAIDPTTRGAAAVANQWKRLNKKEILPGNFLSMAWRLATGKNGLFSNRRLRHFLESHVLRNIRTFADIRAAELYVVSVILDSGELHVFGVDQSEPVLDALMATTAAAPFLPPWEYQGRLFVDGAFMSDLPIRVAVDMGATEIYAVDIGFRRKPRHRYWGILNVIQQVVSAASYEHFQEDMQWAKKLPAEKVHYVSVQGFEKAHMWELSHTAEMIEVGKRAGLEHIAGLLPISVKS
jgi:NTE family protein